MFGKWLNKITETADKVIGKAKQVGEKAIGMYNKGKAKYGAIKEKVTSLPVIGGLAGNLIEKGERMAQEKYKEKTGRELLDDIGRAEGIAEKGMGILNTGEGLVRRARRMGAE
jgi:hypothetical protein